MIKPTPTSKFWIDIAQCLRLFYWTYFKPFTLSRWLHQNIDPELEPSDNPFEKQVDFASKPQLYRYGLQTWLVNGTVPPLGVLLLAPLYSQATGAPFYWQLSGLLLPGWWVGLWLSSRSAILQRLFSLFLGILLFGVTLCNAIFNYSSSVMEVMPSALQAWTFVEYLLENSSSLAPLCSLAIGLCCAAGFGMATGVAGGAMFGTGLGMAIGAAGVFGFGLWEKVDMIGAAAFGASLGMIGGITFGVTSGGVRNIAVRLSRSVSFGVAIGAAIGTAISLLSNQAIISVPIGIAIGGAIGGAVSVAITMASGAGGIQQFDILSGLTVGILGGLAFGAGGVAGFGWEQGIGCGVSFSVAYILGVLRFYFWLPELVWMIMLFFSGRKAIHCLNYLPSNFDELIVLPMPFIDTVIAQAYRENRAAARRMINYLTTSTKQQQKAARAMAAIAVDSLKQCQTLREIVAISEQLAWIPSPPPKQLGSVLPQFLEISQSVRAAETGTSAYRQTELLNLPITSLINLRDSLAFSQDAHLATTFGSIIERWLSILQAARSNLEQQARHSQEIPQVYIAGNALDPETAKSRFKGRQDLFREIETLALSFPPPVLLLYGGRRTGKTSVLKYLPHKLGAEIVPLLVDLHGVADATTLPGVAKSLASQIIEAARKSRNLRLPVPDTDSLEKDPFPALRNWFNQIERNASGKRFLLCLDEFERLSEVVAATGSKAPLNFLRNVMQHRQSWILLFSGAHTLDEIEDYWCDYLINTRSLRVTYLEEQDARELIVKPVDGFPIIYESEAVNRIIYWTRCQPYLVQLMCSVLVDYLNHKASEDARLKKATPENVETIIPKLFETGGMYFWEFWERTLTTPERNLLLHLIKGKTLEGESKALRKLVHKEILEKKADGYCFQVPLIEQYIEREVLGSL
ncbi:MAG: AAA family ATPase [Symploca sp. SIO1C4]|uniref:AAA family ATPase n=1 Tax=Symploca sp. SIO1C4 TaxID=2607765 RepID=A0A6B3N8T7_9CYAN|nr:AAA family ATPase [Symploca sp. SIO1C4]